MTIQPVSPGFFMMIIFTITALINLVLFSWFSREQDLKDTHRSLVIAQGILYTERLLKIMFIAQLMLILATWFLSGGQAWYELIILLSMNLILGGLFIFSERFVRQDNYRLVGDFIFFIPIVFLLSHA